MVVNGGRLVGGRLLGVNQVPVGGRLVGVNEVPVGGRLLGVNQVQVGGRLSRRQSGYCWW